MLEDLTEMMLKIQKAQLKTEQAQLKTEAGWKEVREAQLKTDRQLDRMEEDTMNLKKHIGGMANSQEEIGIDLFRRNMKDVLAKRNIKIDDVTTKFKNKIKLKDGTLVQGEYDLMGINGKDIVVVEVKNRLRNDDISKFLKTQLPRFKTLFPQYKDYNLYGGIGSLVVGEHQEEIAEKAGLFVFTQGKDGNACIMNKEGFKGKIF